MTIKVSMRAAVFNLLNCLPAEGALEVNMDIMKELDFLVTLAIRARNSGADAAWESLFSQLRTLKLEIPKAISKEAKAIAVAGMIAGLDQHDAARQNACKKAFTREDFHKERA